MRGATRAMVCGATVLLATATAGAQSSSAPPERFTLPDLPEPGAIPRTIDDPPDVVDMAHVTVVDDEEDRAVRVVPPGNYRALPLPAHLVLAPRRYELLFEGARSFSESIAVPPGRSTVHVRGLATGRLTVGLVFGGFATAAALAAVVVISLPERGFEGTLFPVLAGGGLGLGWIVFSIPAIALLATCNPARADLVPDESASARASSVRFLGASLVPIDHGAAVSGAIAF